MGLQREEGEGDGAEEEEEEEEEKKAYKLIHFYKKISRTKLKQKLIT